MEKLETLSRDLGFGPRGKSNPMRSATPSSSSSIHHQPLDDLFHFSLLPGRPTPDKNELMESTSSSSFFDMPQSYMFPTSDGHGQGQVWLTVTEIPLSTLPTAAPAPSRPPPPVPHRASFSTSTKNADHIYSTYVQNQPLYEPEMENNDTQGSDQMEIKERLEREEREQRQERDKVRHAVETASRDARQKAAAETRRQAERAAVDKANAEARRRAERAAVQRVQAEARERAAAGAKERAEKAKAEAEAEARRRAEQSAVDRERTAAESRESAATATQMNQQKNDNDVEAFFMGRASSAPRTRADSTEPLFDQRFQNGGGSATVNRTPSSTGTSSSMKKASSTTNIVDDLSSLFGGASSPGEFQEVEGETEDRRRARLESHQRTKDRVDKALAEKNQRDLQAQRDQEERHRISETLDFQIKRWAAGKEGNLRALLSTLQYVLWPECGWQPVSLTDIITGASVKKVYRKATLCIHPDKVQQKGASLQQKYIAEKVFDLLKEAWNKLNSEELF